jgi:hypothetical protein
MTTNPHAYLTKGRQQFARANRWRISKSYFSPRMLAAGKMYARCWEDYGTDNGFDHTEWYRKDRWPVAIVGHNYDGARNDEIDRLLNHFDMALQLYVAPAGTAASWYYPGGTTLLVITRRDAPAIIWPTAEEMAAMVVDHVTYWEWVRAREQAAKRRRITAAAGAVSFTNIVNEKRGA